MQGHLNTPVLVHSTLYVWTTLSQYILLCTQQHSTQYTCTIHPTLYLKLLHTTTYPTDTSYTVYMDVPSNTPARHTHPLSGCCIQNS